MNSLWLTKKHDSFSWRRPGTDFWHHRIILHYMWRKISGHRGNHGNSWRKQHHHRTEIVWRHNQSRGVTQTSVLRGFSFLECIIGVNSCEWKNKYDNKYSYEQYLLSLEITKCHALLSVFCCIYVFPYRFSMEYTCMITD